MFAAHMGFAIVARWRGQPGYYSYSVRRQRATGYVFCLCLIIGEVRRHALQYDALFVMYRMKRWLRRAGFELETENTSDHVLRWRVLHARQVIAEVVETHYPK